MTRASGGGLHAFAVCLPGLEPFVARELDTLDVARPRPVRGGVEFTASARQLYLANAWLRTATRVTVRIARFTATDFARLEREIAGIDWTPWFGADRTPRFAVSSSRSRLYHTDAIAERFARAFPPVPAGADTDAAPTVFVRVVDDTFTVSVDSSGEPLHRRGWRQATAKAPLRPTLAAAMLMAAGWHGDVPLCDPLCGAGTIAIEAALVASARAPGAGREFEFQRWPSFQPGTWASVTATFRPGEAPAVPIIAGDRDAGAIEAARANAQRAGVAELVDLRVAAFSDTLHSLAAYPEGLLITNPPYGTRVRDNRGPSTLARALGAARRQEIAGWHCGVLVDAVAQAKLVDRAAREQFRSTNGGIAVGFYLA